MMRTQFAKVKKGFSSSSRGRGTHNFSTIPSSSSISSIVKRRWENQNVPILCVAFLGGYIAHFYINYQKRKEHWYKVDRMYNETFKRSEELDNRFDRYIRGDYDDPESRALK
ncbi:unnamed protein product [Arabidopsis lyrata]|uniref:uncharacterized protein LOC110226657 n=1 Tax=Arabidopsis lyrata subsp. lyrata TaxID=81972 RepID=UPI000A29B844|nr:uncharacterized protein LOC110226657 [Arabidopsis lyrata subsp. lyrata]CAH8274266.1 unnamed protein product [Arabidopsis lyrata]|eukprot:XP_020874646.1 uncharacterized protein LOC110226657 [Arabidopsis lyrata subsp. lyrata]